MGVARMLLLLVLTISAFSSIQARSHHHHHHHYYHPNPPAQSIALPPDADPPTEAPEPPNATTLPSAQPPPAGSYGNSTNSTSVPISTPNAPPPNAGSYGNSTNSTSISFPPVQPPPAGSYGNSTNSTSVPISTPNAPPNAGSYGNSTNSTSISSPPASPPIPSDTKKSPNLTSVFDVRSFGAIGDGVSDDTEAFKSAWVSACDDSAGVVLAPQGYSFMIRSTIFTGPCNNGVVFQIDGIVMAPDGPDSWPQSNSRRQWLVFYRADGLSLQGAGLIDGRGQKWWDLPCKPHKGINGTTAPGPCDSPVALRFFQSSNLSVHGLKIKNSPQFHFRFDNCKNVIVDSISINSSALSPNTDGIHVENTNTVGIYHSIISTGDDCISIGSGSLNVDIQNVTCGPSHGISIGSLGKQNSRACVTNITVKNTIIKHSDNGVRIKTWQGGSGSVSSISFANIRMDTVRNPIIIDQYYCLSKGCDNQTSAVYISDIEYSNIKGTYDVRSPPIHFGCSDSVPCTNITLTDVELFPAQGEIIADPFCWNIYGNSPTPTIPPVSCLLEGLPRSIMEIESDKCY